MAGVRAERPERLQGDFWLPAALAAGRPSDVSPADRCDDFWLPVVAGPRLGTVDDAADDFWLGGGYIRPDAPALPGPETPLPDIRLPWFEGDLAIRPAEIPTVIRTPETMAQRRARWLVQLLDEPLAKRRAALRSYFAELFAEFPAQQTFQALAALALNGGGGDALRNACEFKRWVLADRLLLARRVTGGDYFIPQSGNGSLISWARCFRLGAYCGGDDPTDHFEPGWFDEWLEMAPGDGNSLWFVDYFEQRLRAKYLGYWQVEETAPRRSAPVFAGGVGAWCRSTIGQWVFSSPEHIGVINQEPRGLVVAPYGRSRLGTAGHRVLG